MTTLTIDLANERIEQLKERAEKVGVTIEYLVQISVDQFLDQSDENFNRALDYVLQKNADLYQRLA